MINLNAANEESHQGGATLVAPELVRGVDTGKPTASMVQTNPYDTAIAQAQLKKYEIEIAEMHKKASVHKITSDDSNVMAVEMATQSKRLYNEVEKLRKAITDTPRLFIASINSFAKVYTSKLQEIERGLKDKIGSYAHKVEMARREAEQKAQEAARKLQAKIDKDAKAKNIEPVHVPVPVIKTKAEPIRTASGSSSTRKDWKWEAVDISQVPREYLMLDSVKINKAVKAGMREIKGLRIFEKISVSLRG